MQTLASIALAILAIIFLLYSVILLQQTYIVTLQDMFHKIFIRTGPGLHPGPDKDLLQSTSFITIALNYRAILVSLFFLFVLLVATGTVLIFSIDMSAYIWIFLILSLIALAISSALVWRDNPYKSVWLAEHQANSGKIRFALNTYCKAAMEGGVSRTIRFYMQDWPIEEPLQTAAREVMYLHRDAILSQDRGISKILTGRTADEARRIADALWTTVDRFAAVRTQGIPSDRLQSELEHEAENLRRVAAGVREVREGLARALLSGGASAYLQASLGTLQQLAGMARTL